MDFFLCFVVEEGFEVFYGMLEKYDFRRVINLSMNYVV